VACRDVAPELALGIAVGDERAAALDHLAGCDECRQAMARLTETVDAVVQTTPSVEPPSGFEVRALASFEPSTPTSAGGRSWRRVAAIAAALVVVLGLAAAIGALATRSSGTDQTADRSTAALQTPGGVEVGSVRVERSASGTSDLVVSVDAGAHPGTYRVECDYESGGPYRAGEIEIGSDGVDEWRTTVSVPTDDLSRVRLVSTGAGDNLEAEFGT
jgi:hypothetical protein